MEQKFIDYMRFGRGMSELSIKKYCSSIRMLEQFHKGKELSKLSEEDLLCFIINRSSNGAKNITVNGDIAAIRRYYMFCSRFISGKYSRNTAKNIEYMQKWRTNPECMPEEAINKALENLRSDSLKCVRTKAIIMMLYMCGLRASELINIKLSDIKNDKIMINGKGKRQRYITLPLPLQSQLKKYMLMRCCSSEYLFTTIDGNPFSYGMLLETVRCVFRNLVPLSMRHPHALRHAYATKLISSGMRIEQVAALMGHSDIRTTMRYISICSSETDEKIKNIFN